MPNFKGTREGLGFNRDCVCCGDSFEIFSVRQIRCRQCASDGKTIPMKVKIKRKNDLEKRNIIGY